MPPAPWRRRDPSVFPLASLLRAGEIIGMQIDHTGNDVIGLKILTEDEAPFAMSSAARSLSRRCP